MGLAVWTECCSLSFLPLALRMLCLLCSMMDTEGPLECPRSLECLWRAEVPLSCSGDVRDWVRELRSTAFFWNCGETGNGGGGGDTAGVSDDSGSCCGLGRVGGWGSAAVSLVVAHTGGVGLTSPLLLRGQGPPSVGAAGVARLDSLRDSSLWKSRAVAGGCG